VWSGEIKAEMLQVMINSRHQDRRSPALVRPRNGRWTVRAGETLELAAGNCASPSRRREIVGKTTTEDLSTPSSASFASGNDREASAPLLAHLVNAAALQIFPASWRCGNSTSA